MANGTHASISLMEDDALKIVFVKLIEAWVPLAIAVERQEGLRET